MELDRGRIVAIDHVHETMEIIEPIFKVVVGFWFIARLRFSSRKTVGTMHSAGNMYERKMEGEDRHYPSVNGRARIEVRISEHSFDVMSVDFDNEVANADKIYFEGAKCVK